MTIIFLCFSALKYCLHNCIFLNCLWHCCLKFYIIGMNSYQHVRFCKSASSKSDNSQNIVYYCFVCNWICYLLYFYFKVMCFSCADFYPTDHDYKGEGCDLQNKLILPHDHVPVPSQWMFFVKLMSFSVILSLIKEFW